MPNEEFSLDREMNIENNVDATGKKWNVHTERGRHLFYALPEGARPDAIIPDKLQGKFTKRMYLETEIKRYVQESWDHADRIAQKNERKAQAAKEAANGRKQEAKESTDTPNANTNVSKPSSSDNKESKGKK